MTRVVCFEAEDLCEELPPPGFYSARISTARFRTSAAGNPTFQVVYAVDDVPRRFERIAEYFVLEGEHRYAIVRARRALVDLYRACGRSPSAGAPIAPLDLLGAKLDVQLEHDHHDGRPRLRVAGHHRLGACDTRAPF